VLILYNPVLNFNVAELTNRIGGDEKLAKAISPTRHLAKDSPPTLLFFGKEDRLLRQSEEFIAKSKELGHKAEIFLADGVGHGFFNKAPWQERTTIRADEFLISLGYLKEQK
jgi:acetyl esterase/lipase